MGLRTDDGILATRSELFLHIGMQYGSPFRPTFAVLLREDTAAAAGDDVAPEYLLLKATGEFVVSFIVAEAMDQKDKWIVQLYHVQDSARPVPAMIPGLVSVEKAGATEIEVWPCTRGRMRRVVRRAIAPPSSGDEGGGDSAGEGDGGGEAIEDMDVDEVPPIDEAGEALGDDFSDELEDDDDAVARRADADRAFDELLADVCAGMDAAVPEGEDGGEPPLPAPEADPLVLAGPFVSPRHRHDFIIHLQHIAQVCCWCVYLKVD